MRENDVGMGVGREEGEGGARGQSVVDDGELGWGGGKGRPGNSRQFEHVHHVEHAEKAETPSIVWWCPAEEVGVEEAERLQQLDGPGHVSEVEETEMVAGLGGPTGPDGRAVAAQPDAGLGYEEGLEAVQGRWEGVLWIGEDDAGV